jgi:glycosyltransferase involved in cell wall biosynthesis
MDLTVCICTHDRPHYLRFCLQGLRRQTVAEDRFDVLIIDSGLPEPARSEVRELARQYPGARLVQVDEAGVSAARNAGAAAALTDYIAYIDADAIPAETWVEAIFSTLGERADRPALLGGRILAKWEAPPPPWWPRSPRGLMSIIQHEGMGEFRTAELPPGLEPNGCNMIVHVASLLDAGGFGRGIGRIAGVPLSNEDVQLAWRLQDAGLSVRYDSNIAVYHHIQEKRLNPDWLLSRLYWQGASTVLTHRLSHDGGTVWRKLPRRLLVAALFAPAALWPRASTSCLAIRWRQAYAAGFVRAAVDWRATAAARRMARLAPAAPSAATPWVPRCMSTRLPILAPYREATAELTPEPARMLIPEAAAEFTLEPTHVLIREPTAELAVERGEGRRGVQLACSPS